jgi:hypothetical protein
MAVVGLQSGKVLAKIITAIIILLTLNMGGCFTAMVYVDEVSREGLWHTKVTDVSRYEEMRERVGRTATPQELEILPARIPASSTQTRMEASFGKRYAGLLLLCRLPSAEARQIAEWARPRAVSIRDDVDTSTLGKALNIELPTKFETITWDMSMANSGLGSSTFGTSARIQVNEEEGFVIWSLVHYPPALPTRTDSGEGG